VPGHAEARNHSGIPFKLIAVVLPLCLDTFAVSAALGVAGLSKRERWRLSLVMAGFEVVSRSWGSWSATWSVRT
jgi:hypothetical protein